MSKIQIRRGTTSEWTASNPVLASGELGLDTTTGVIKTGNGSSTWSVLTTTYASGTLMTTVQGQITPTAWTIPTYATGWQNYGGGYTQVGYRKIGDLVYMRGLLQATTGVTATAWTFPTGFRPPYTLLTGVMTSANLWRRIDVSTAGVMTITSPAVGEWFAMDSVPPFSITAT